jgi:hypothetical protein
MSELRVSAHEPTKAAPAEGLTVDRLRTIVQDSHLNFLIGAGTPSAFFSRLGNIEGALTALVESGANDAVKAYVRASLQGYFFEHVVVPNIELVNRGSAAKDVVTSYATFLRTLNRILLRRRSSLLGKQVSIFTTNVDMVFEVALELMEIDVNDGFNGKIRPRLDLGEFNTLRFRQGTRYEYRSEIPVVNLFKIHGSAAWRQGEANDIWFDHGLTQIEEVLHVYNTAKSELIEISDPEQVDVAALISAAGDRALSESGLAFAEAYSKLSIVNPEKTKFATTVLNQTYYELIRRFANELEKENSALFVHGFSFRDEHLRDLVLRAARTNPTLQVIVFCHSRSGRDEVQKLFPSEQVKNGNILLVAPAAPKEGEAERPLSLDTLEADYFAPIVADKAPTPDHVIELNFRQDAEEPHDA